MFSQLLALLIDTGEGVSIYSQDLHSTQGLFEIRGITGQSLSVLGRVVYSLDVGFNSVLTHELIVEQLTCKIIILGTDLLSKHQLKDDFNINGLSKRTT